MKLTRISKKPYRNFGSLLALETKFRLFFHWWFWCATTLLCLVWGLFPEVLGYRL